MCVGTARTVAAQGQAPYTALATHGFVLDGAGRKMSKSLGNTIDPSMIVHGGADKRLWPGHGVDVLRLWVASTEYANDMTLSPVVIGSCCCRRGGAAARARGTQGPTWSGSGRALHARPRQQKKWPRRIARFATRCGSFSAT